MFGFDFINPRSIAGRGFIWKIYQDEDFFDKNRFTLEQWHNILDGIDNKEEFNNYLDRYKDILTCYVLYRTDTSEPIAMCLILEENGWYDNCFSGEVVSVHGGGWEKSTSSKFIYAKAWIMMIDYLNNLGCKILTDFNPKNESAKHLITGTGFTYNEEINMYEYSENMII